MASLYFSTICIFAFAMFVTTLDGRKVPGDGFGQNVKPEHSLMTEVIGDYVINVDLVLPLSEKKMDCNTETKQSIRQKKQSAKEFEPRPNVSIYDNEIKLKDETKSVKDFEPRPNISIYDNEIEVKKENKNSIKDFEPRPNISIYDNEIKLKEDYKSFSEDFESRPSVTSYRKNIGMNKHKSFLNDFEERRSATKYRD